MEVTLKFYDDKKLITLPENYEKFISQLALMLGVPNNMLNVNIFYIDCEGDQIMIVNSEDYKFFIEDVKNKTVSTIEIALNDDESEESLKEKLRESFTKFPSMESIISNKNEGFENYNKKPIIDNIDKKNINNDNKENIEIPQLIQAAQIIEQKLKKTQNYNNMIRFNLKCNVCGKNPINLLIYKCYECNLYYCNDCEIKEGLNHPHPLLKIRTNEQLKKWDHILSKINFQNNEIIHNNESSNNKNDCNIEIKFKKQIENARKTYDLGNISDKELNEALIKTNGKIDEAVFELFKY